MSKLSDLKNVNEHINQGTLYQEKRRQTLGSFSTLEDNETENTYGILEPFLAITQQTDGNDDQAGTGAGYSDLSLNELYVIYKEKLVELDKELNDLSGSKTLVSSFGSHVINFNGAIAWFSDGTNNHKIRRYSDSDVTDISVGHDINGPDFVTDNSYSDAVLLTCAEMSSTDISTNTTPSFDSDLSEIDSVCNPFSTGADNFKTAINLITQLNELVSVMKTKAGEGDTSLMIDLDQTLSEAQNKYNSVVQNKVAFEPEDETNYSDDSSGYLEIEGLKYDSAKLLYIILVLGTLILGGITVSRIIKASK